MSFNFQQNQTQNNGTGRYCPSCGRYIGHYDICPYCGARVKTRVSLKALAILALIIAVSGTVALYYAANVEPPKINIEDITPEMNYARVRITGYAVSSASYDEATGRIYFRMVDEEMTYNEEFGTNVISVYIYHPTSRDLLEEGKIPVTGDKVEVVGTLKVRDYISLTINYPEDLVIKREKPVDVTLDDLMADWESYLGKSVRITGWITRYSDKGTMLLAGIRDYYAETSEELSLYIPGIIVGGWLGELEKMGLGYKVEIVGNIWEYRGEPELIPWNATSISIVEPLKITPLSEIWANQEFYGNNNVYVLVNATILGHYKSGGTEVPNIIYINDESLQDYSLTLYITSYVWYYELNDTQREFLNTINEWILVFGQCTYYYSDTGKEFEIKVSSSTWLYFNVSSMVGG